MPDGAMGPPGAWNSMASHLKALVPSVCPKKPAAVLVISAHWRRRSPRFELREPPLLYDYYGFPRGRVRAEVAGARGPGAGGEGARAARGWRVQDRRGREEGVRSRGLHPEAVVPGRGRAHRAALARRGVGPGETPRHGQGPRSAARRERPHHRLRANRSTTCRDSSAELAEEPAREFDRWLNETCVGVEPRQRSERLRNWTAAPSARAVHPREEHLAPLFVAAGAAEDERASGCSPMTCWISPCPGSRSGRRASASLLRILSSFRRVAIS